MAAFDLSWRSAIAAEFKTATRQIFGNDLVLAFIFGGFGKGYGAEGHDIDMFVLTRRPAPPPEKFLEFYFDVHRRNGLPADTRYPGEIVDTEDLDRRLTLLEHSRLRPVIETQYEYEGILWADALSEAKLGLTFGRAPASCRAEEFLTRAQALAGRWRNEILAIRPEDADVLRQLDLRRLFKGYITYRKTPGIPPVPPA